jgi:hypothetical protein
MITESDILKLSNYLSSKPEIQCQILSIYRYGSNDNVLSDTDLLCIIEPNVQIDDIEDCLKTIFPTKNLDLFIAEKPIFRCEPLISTTNEFSISVIINLLPSELIYGVSLQIMEPSQKSLENYMLFRLVKDLVKYQQISIHKDLLRNRKMAKILLSVYLSSYCIDILERTGVTDKQTILKKYSPQMGYQVKSQDLAFLYKRLRFYGPPVDSKAFDLFNMKLSEFIKVTTKVADRCLRTLPLIIGRLQDHDVPIELGNEQIELLSSRNPIHKDAHEQFWDNHFYLYQLFDKLVASKELQDTLQKNRYWRG